MSYISSFKEGNNVIVWERTSKGREIKTFPAPYYFYIKDNHGKYTNIYGEKLTKLEFDTGSEFYQAKQQCQSDRIQMFESDIPPEIKILSEHYYNVPAPKLNITYLDIEVDYSTEIGFSSIDNPYAPINSVALYHAWSNKMIVIAVPPDTFTEKNDIKIKQLMNDVCPLPTDVDIEIIICGTEKHLLMELMSQIENSDLLSGWNSNAFDVPYIGRRLEKYSNKAFKMLSFPEGNPPKWREVENDFRKTTYLDLCGRLSADYMILFRKYEMDQHPSYKLESIADTILIDKDNNPVLPKLQYEGSLASLYKKDFIYFIRYNLRDTEILKGFEERLGYVELANQMYHLSTGSFEHVTGTLKLSELAVINYCHHELNGLVVNDTKEPDIDRQIRGALVLYPQIGLHEWIGSIDINSLYPSAIRSLNISPETLRGQFINDIRDFEEIQKQSDKILTLILEDGEEQQFTAVQWGKILQERKWAISGYGTVFDQTKRGIVPTILGTWFTTRKHYQKLAKEARDAGDDVKAVYYDKQSYCLKIKLNSFYGALSNLYFKFYDIRMGESVTGTGRVILKHQCRKVSELLGDGYDVDFPQYIDEKEAIERGGDPLSALNGPIFKGEYPSKSVIYSDTDSCLFKTYANTKDEAIKVADSIAEIVNKSFIPFMRKTFFCNDQFDNIIKTGREIVSPRGIFVDKKRYMLHIINLDGRNLDKMKIMGVDTKKTTLPKWISTYLNKFIERFLKGEEWAIIEKDIMNLKEQLRTTNDIMSIGLPKGVKGVEDYTQRLKTNPNTMVPGHIRGAIKYNQCLKEYDDKQSTPIVSNMKIKNFYITNVIGKWKSVAIPTDIEQIPTWFIDNFQINRKMHIERLVDNPLENILRAINKRSPTKQSILFDNTFE